jgi:hypothetical protein
MSAVLSAWFTANKVRILEYGAIVILILAIFFAIWFSMHQRQELAEQVGLQKGTIATLTKQVDALNAQVLAEQAARDAQLRDFQAIVAESQRLNDDLAAIRTDIAKQQAVITKHDLGKIGAAKPSLLEKRINKATRDQNKRFEEATRP